MPPRKAAPLPPTKKVPTRKLPDFIKSRAPSPEKVVYPKTVVEPGTLRHRGLSRPSSPAALECTEEMCFPSGMPRIALDPLSPSPVGSPSPPWSHTCPPPAPLSPHSEERERRLDEVSEALRKLEEHVEQRTAAFRRENADYFEGDTPKTSQDSDLSEYCYSERSATDIVPLDGLVDFVMHYKDTKSIHAAIAPFAEMSEEEARADPVLFKGVLLRVLNCEPDLLRTLVSSAVREAEKEAEEGRLRAMLGSDLP